MACAEWEAAARVLPDRVARSASADSTRRPQADAGGELAEYTVASTLAEAVIQPPLQLAAAVATVEASLWVRNGQCMSEQVLNYHSPPLCRHMSDLDLLVLQLGASQA